MADFPQIVALFQELDRTGSGTIGRDEMQAVLVSAWGWSPAEVEEVLAIYSDNSSNVVMYADFLMWLFGLDGSQEAAASVPVDAREEEEEELGEEAPATPADDKNTSEAASSVTAAALADAAVFKATASAPEVVEEEGKEEAASSLSDALSEEEVEGAALARAHVGTKTSKDVKYRRRIEAMRAVKEDGLRLKSCSSELRGDKVEVLEAVKQNGLAFQHCSESLRNDKDVAREALKSCPAGEVHSLFGILSKETQSNYDVALMALRMSSGEGCSTIYSLLSKELQDNETVNAVTAIKSLGRNAAYDRFKTLSKEMQNNKEVAMTALERSGAWADDVFKLLSKDLQNSKEVAMEALARVRADDVPKVFQLISKELQNNEEVAMQALANVDAYYVPNVFQLISKELQNNEEVAMQALKTFLGAFECISAIDRNDKRFVLEAVKRNGSALQFCSEPLRNDKDVATEAVMQCGDALAFCSEDLRGDKDVVMKAAAESATALKFALRGLSQDRECLAAAGLWAAQDAVAKRPEQGILSVKFGFQSSASNLSTIVADELAKHPKMKNFTIYNPNLFSKKSCDPDYTNLAWPCRGTASTCQLAQKESTPIPSLKSCWRYSFRYHQRLCKETAGFMIQLEEYGKLGPGQIIETEMALDLGLKIFRFRWNHPEQLLSEGRVRSVIANLIADTILAWFDDKKRDLGIQIFEA